MREGKRRQARSDGRLSEGGETRCSGVAVVEVGAEEVEAGWCVGECWRGEKGRMD